MKIIGTKFVKTGQYGDFEWMCQQEEFSNSLFIFNDNEEYHHTNRKGKGNAVIRKYNKYNDKLEKPKSAGIPTGTLKNRGYSKLNTHVKEVVTEAISEIIELINKYNYETIYYSIGPDNKLGTGLFNVNRNVIDFIDNLINSLASLPIQTIK